MTKDMGRDGFPTPSLMESIVIMSRNYLENLQHRLSLMFVTSKLIVVRYSCRQQ